MGKKKLGKNWHIAPDTYLRTCSSDLHQIFKVCRQIDAMLQQEGLAVASIARDDPLLFPACTATTMRPHALRLVVHAGAL